MSVCVFTQTHLKSCTHTHTQKPHKTQKKQQKNKHSTAQLHFLTMLSESGKLESTMMHRAHNGLTNCSFVSENAPLFERFCHHSVRETHSDRLCVAVICRVIRVHVKCNIIFQFLYWL